MSREIKFRVFDKANKKMIYDANSGFRFFLNGCVSESGVWCTKDVELLQFTGLKDKNGKEIYEGDILRYNYHLKFDEDWKGSRENPDFIGVVEYHDKILNIGYESDETRFVGFILCSCKGTDDEYYTTIPKLEDIEVVGNIYENQELLEEE